MTTPVNSRDVYLQTYITRTTNNSLLKEEKAGFVAAYANILAAQTTLDSQAVKYSISTELTNFDAAVLALKNYLAGLTIPVLWSDSSNMTLFSSRNDFNDKFAAVYNTKSLLEVAITNKTDITGYLTTQTVAVSADSLGAVADFTPANGTFKVFLGSNDVTTTGPVYSLVSSTGISISINASTGVYSLTAMSLNTGRAVFRVVYGSKTLELNYTVTKVLNGVSGTRTAILDVYQWSLAAPATFPSGTSTYTWATGQFTAPATLNSWTLTPGNAVLGQTLWVARTIFADTYATTTSSITWSANVARPMAASGINGVSTYTWIKYATSATGAGISDSPTNMTYIGLAHNQPSASESTTASDYTWSLIKGSDGVPGTSGVDGLTYYTWIKYSDNITGTTPYDVPTTSTIAIGIAVNKTTATESTTYTDYTWSKFKGDQGVKGADGTRTAVLEVYKWAATVPTTFPQGTSTYTWATGVFTDANTNTNGWSLLPGAATLGFWLYACSVSLPDSTTTATTSVTWNTSAAYIVGYAGTNGANGTTGAGGNSYKTAYMASVTTSSSATPTEQIDNNANTTYPGTGNIRWGLSGNWVSTVPTLASGEYLYQTDGIYNPVANTTTWSRPYWSSLRVGSLNLIVPDTGNLNVSGIIKTSNDVFSVSSAGAVVARAISIQDADGNVILASGGNLDYSRVAGTKPPSDATKGAAFGTNITGQITQATASTYIADAAIGNAQIGSLSVDKFTSGLSGGNLLSNSSFTDSVNGIPNYWFIYNNNLSSNIGTNLSDVSWTPVGGVGYTIYQPNNWYNTPKQANYFTAYYTEVVSEAVPIVALEYYEASIFNGSHRCPTVVAIYFYDSSGGTTGGTWGTDNIEEFSGGKSLSGYKRLFVIAKAPLNSSTARLVLRKGATFAGNSDSWSFNTQPLLCKANGPSQTIPSPYTASGLVTQITGGVIKTGTITAEKLGVTSLSAITANIGLLRTTTSGQRTELDSSGIRVYDTNNVLRVRMGVF